MLELGHMVSAAYATKLMADLGAEVIKIEEPGGDPAPGGLCGRVVSQGVRRAGRPGAFRGGRRGDAVVSLVAAPAVSGRDCRGAPPSPMLARGGRLVHGHRRHHLAA